MNIYIYISNIIKNLFNKAKENYRDKLKSNLILL